jgi:hypothetical protein
MDVIVRRLAVRAVLLSAIVAALAAVAAAGASARAQLPASAVPWVGQYTLEVSGDQNGSWTEHHQPQGACDGGETGSGNEDVTLTPSGSTPVFVAGVGPTLTSIMLAALSDYPKPGDPNSVPQTFVNARATVIRQGSVQDGAPADPTQCPSGDGGGTVPTPDCGAKQAQLQLWFDQQSSMLHFEQPDGSAPNDPFNDCPYLGSGVFPTWTPADVLIPPSGWGPPPPIGTANGLPVELHGEATSQQHDADLDASVSEHLTLRFLPLYVTPTIVVGDVSSERVSSDGAIGVPVTCPKGEKPGCSGTVALVIDVATASAAGAESPNVGSVVTIAKASFSLKPGVHRRLTIKIAHASKPFLSSVARAPLAMVVTLGGKHKIRYVAAQTKLRT